MLSSILILSCLFCRAQSSSNLLNLPLITPPSPNATSLGKYGDIPVGLYTGIPNISIPLYTIKVGNFTLPISLSYHSQGLKVEETAGWVGLGWSLNAGGAVTRTAHGLPDEKAAGYWYYPNWTDDTVAALGAGTGAFCGGSFYDMQPDMFYYNFGSYSGKFVMDQTPTHNAHFIPFNDLQLTYQVNLPVNDGLSQFQITDDNGIIYIFGAIETTTDESSTTSIAASNSSWYLTQIVTPAGNINFTYATEATYATQFSEMDYLNTGPNENNQFNPGYSGSYRILSFSSVILSSISFPTGTVTFSKTGNRKDFVTASAITGMAVTDLNNVLQHKFTFSESYFGDTSSTSDAVRLKLDSVSEISVTDTAQKKAYRFSYNNPSQVPSIKSLAQDFWGFYNGQTRNTSLLPPLSPTIYGAYIANQEAFSGVRTPSAAYAQTGILNTIQYPTGGTTQLIYEGNDYGNGLPGWQSEYATEEAQASATAIESSLVDIPSKTVDFSVNPAQGVSVSINGSYTGPTPLENGPTLILNQINSDGSRTNIFSYYTVNSLFYEYPYLNPGNYELIASVDGTSENMTGTLTYYTVDSSIVIKTFPTGGLRIRQIVNTDPASGQTNTKTYRYYSATDTTASSGTLISAPVYLENEDSYATGMNFDVVSSSSLNYLGTTQGSHVAYSTVTEIDSSAVSIGKKVSGFNASRYPNLNANMHYVSAQNILNTPPTTNSLRYMTDNDVYRGVLTSEITYNAANNIVKKKYIIYNTDSLNAANYANGYPNYYQLNAIAGYSYNICIYPCSGCGCTSTSPTGCSTCSTYFLDNYTLADYVVPCPWIYKTSEIDTTYDVNGANPIGTVAHYYYDNPVDGLVTRIVTTNSKGETLETLNKYAPDQAQISGLSANASSALSSLVTMNKIASPIEVDHYNNGNLLDLARTDYYVWNASPLVVEPQHIWYQTLTNSIEDRVDYYQYDGNSNPLEVAKTSDVHHSYIWDYQDQLPIAEVVNASQSDIAYTSFEANGSGNWTIPDTNRVYSPVLTGNISYSLGSGAISKSGLTSSTPYIVSYWLLNGSGSVTVSSGSASTGGIVLNGWTYYEVPVSGASSVSVSGSGTIDELRLYPKGAQMSTYTYAPLIGMTTHCDASGHLTYYTYDGLGRLHLIKDQYGNILKRYDYEYQSTNQ